MAASVQRREYTPDEIGEHVLCAGPLGELRFGTLVDSLVLLG